MLLTHQRITKGEMSPLRSRGTRERGYLAVDPHSITWPEAWRSHDSTAPARVTRWILLRPWPCDRISIKLQLTGKSCLIFQLKGKLYCTNLKRIKKWVVLLIVALQSMQFYICRLNLRNNLVKDIPCAHNSRKRTRKHVRKSPCKEHR